MVIECKFDIVNLCVIIIIVVYVGIICNLIKDINVVVINNLFVNGFINFLKLVIWFLFLVIYLFNLFVIEVNINMKVVIVFL